MRESRTGRGVRAAYLRLAVVGASLAALFPVSTLAAQQAPALEPAVWLAGCWAAVSPDGRNAAEEQWMAPRGGLMVGMSRTVRDGTARGRGTGLPGGPLRTDGHGLPGRIDPPRPSRVRERGARLPAEDRLCPAR
jgi:hypothetical protein